MPETGPGQGMPGAAPVETRRWATWMGEWALALKNLFLPIFCKQCGLRLLTEENGFFCPTCWDASPRIQRPFCTRCGRPHPGAVGFGTLSNFPCAACRERPSRHIRRVYGAAVYDAAIAEAIKWFKFRNRPHLARPLGELLRDFAQREMEQDRYDLVTPVPLHRVRERTRGYNQSRLLAEQVLPAFGSAALDVSLKRIRPTRTQSHLSEHERAANVRGAFAVLGDSCRGKRVLLVDDVVTTHCTVAECAAALRRAGAVEVDVLAVALAVQRFTP